MGRRLWAMIFGVVALAPAIGLADTGKANDRRGVLGAQSAASPVGSAAPKRESPEQSARRKDYVRATGAKIRASTTRATPEIAAVVKKHWRIALRLLRIQTVAERAGKTATAKRAADLLAKEDARFFAKLSALAKAAPAASASAPASPSASAAPK